MIRPWQVWLVFAVCVLAAAGAMAWLTRQAVEADRARRAAHAEAEQEQRVSLAVWRMDTELAPIIAAEVVRPTSAYQPLPLPIKAPEYVKLQFEARDKVTWDSPQVARWSNYRGELSELQADVDYDRLLLELPDTPSALAATGETNPYLPLIKKSLEKSDLPPFFRNSLNDYLAQQDNEKEPTRGQASPSSKAADFQQRGRRYQSAAEQNLQNYQYNQSANAVKESTDKQSSSERKQIDERIGVSRPVWFGNNLVLARRVENAGQTKIQGCLLDWSPLKARLLSQAADLLPKADLVPADADDGGDPSRMLAGLPVRLVVEESVAEASIGPTLRWALWMGWGAVAVAVGAAAALLHGVMTLSERRAAFVSSVTHELRTPLTTFRMYAEMLARGMVPDATRRQEYFETLQRESERLTLLVENVLAYSRLERGHAPRAQDHVTLAALLDRIGPRLKQRAAQAGMGCDVQLDETVATESFTTDAAVVEQILFNLVDNAAKYARNAADRRIHVEAKRDRHFMKLSVRDHGPGIGKGATERSQPFEKSAQESAESAPGVGLGLALCRRLARQLGGRLEVAGANGEGAKVTLLLPVS
jgi:signal transduction histidine kinase